MTFVVDVETVVDRVVLQVGDVTGHINSCHVPSLDVAYPDFSGR
jgi:hypothetical protein